MSDFRVPFKIIIFGDIGVGKRTFLRWGAHKLFDKNTAMTTGIEFFRKELKIDGIKVKLQIWYYVGEGRFRFLFPTYARGANGAIFMYDVTNYSSLAHIDDWLLVVRKEIKSQPDVFPIIVVGNKTDLQDTREVTAEEGIKIARSKGLDGFIECSARTGQNIEETFDALTRLMMRRSKLI